MKQEKIKLPANANLTGRSSTINNAFAQGVTPRTSGTHQDWLDRNALGIKDDECAYCGRHLSSLEADHFHPLVVDSDPLGYITEPHNLLPACSDCNRSKGNEENFDKWYQLSTINDIRAKTHEAPFTQKDLDERKARIKAWTAQAISLGKDFSSVPGVQADLAQYQIYQKQINDELARYQELADSIRARIEAQIHVSQPQIVFTQRKDNGSSTQSVSTAPSSTKPARSPKAGSLQAILRNAILGVLKDEPTIDMAHLKATFSLQGLTKTPLILSEPEAKARSQKTYDLVGNLADGTPIYVYNQLRKKEFAKMADLLNKNHFNGIGKPIIY
jgi:hypothetical protein